MNVMYMLDMLGTDNLNIIFIIIIVLMFVIYQIITANLGIKEITVAISFIFLIISMLYGIYKFSPRVEYILYVFFAIFFIGITCIIMLDYVGEKIFCNLNETNIGIIFLFFGVFVIGTLNFNLIFLNNEITIPYQKIIILLVFYLSSWLLVFLINQTSSGYNADNFSKFIKFSILPGSLYIVCFNSFFYSLYLKFEKSFIKV
jgi:hypothetical protein